MLQTWRHRLTLVSVVWSSYLLLVILDVRASRPTLPGPALAVQVSSSVLVGLIFLLVGSLVWLSSSDRLVSALLLVFCIFAAWAFGVETGIQGGDHFLVALGSMSRSIALVVLAVTLLFFPHNVLASATRYAWMLRGLLVLLLGLCAALGGGTLLLSVSGAPNPRWLGALASCSMLVSLLSSTLAAGFSSRKAASVRERQQVRLLVFGMLVAVVPFLVLTLLPQLLRLPSQFVIESQLSTLTFCLFPAALGYAMVRYHILVFDGMIRKAIVTCVGIVCLFLLAALLVTYSPLLLPHAVPAQVGVLVIGLGTGGSYLWWVIQAKVERLMFSEPQYYQRLLHAHDSRRHGSRDVTIIAASLLEVVNEAFDPVTLCLFLLDEGVGCFRPIPARSEGSEQKLMLEQVFACLAPVTQHGKAADWVDATHPVLRRLATAKRPLFLSELCKEPQTDRRLLNMRSGTRADGTDPLLAAVRIHEHMIGMLALGPRGDTQAYAGPDFEVLENLLASYGSALEVARLAALDAQYAALVMKLFQGMPQNIRKQFSLEEVSQAVGKAIASATASGTDIWLAEEEEGQPVLRLSVRVGTGPHLLTGHRVALEHLCDGGRSACFASWPGTLHWFEHLPVKQRTGDADDAGRAVPDHAFPFAWLPLLHGGHMAGVLILTYPQPHVFSLREQHLLHLCVQQYAGIFKQAQLIQQLQRVAAQQHEREQRQEQAIQNAMMALYRPLTLFEGYVDLLHTSGQSLSADEQHEYFDRAGRAVADLVLKVSEMMENVAIEQSPMSDGKERQ